MTDSIPLDDIPAGAADDTTRRDQYGRYLIVPPGGGKPIGYSRATTIAKVLDSGGGLASWKAAMTVQGLLLRPGLRAQWEALMSQHNGDPWYHDEAGKKAVKGLVEECAAVGGAGDRAQIGLALHAITALMDSGHPPSHLSPETARDVEAYRSGLKSAGIEIVPGAVELTVVLDEHQVAGTFDRLVRVAGRPLPLVADLKTGGSLDYSWQSFAVQLAIYARADALYVQGNAADGSQDRREPFGPVDRDYGVILWLNAGSGRLEVYAVDLAAGWDAFVHSMWTRLWRNAKPFTAGLPPTVELEPALEESLRAQADRAAGITRSGLRQHYEAPWLLSSSTSKRGGPCGHEDCGNRIPAGGYIGKVDTGARGGTTSGGNGLGEWWCEECVVARLSLDETGSDHPSTSRRDWLQGRIDAIGAHPEGRGDLMKAWPRDIPPLKATDTHSTAQLDAIEELLWKIEGRHRMPFPPALEEQAVARVLALFPGATVEPDLPGA
jgi:hypothetical protein